MSLDQELIGSEFVDKTILWDGGNDRPDYVRKQKKKLGKNWYYYDKDIEYKYNTNGFRCPEFNTLDWTNSIVIFGCSDACGVGNTVEDTVAGKLESLLGIPVINLGISGTSIDHACYNSLCLNEHYPNPKAVVHIWSGLGRYAEFNPEGRDPNEHYYPVFGKRWQVVNIRPTGVRYCNKHNWEIRNMFYIKADRQIWKNKTIYYETTFFEKTAKELDIDWLERIDYARDFDHPGHQSNQLMAELIAKNLKERGLTL